MAVIHQARPVKGCKGLLHAEKRGWRLALWAVLPTIPLQLGMLVAGPRKLLQPYLRSNYIIEADNESVNGSARPALQTLNKLIQKFLMGRVNVELARRGVHGMADASAFKHMISGKPASLEEPSSDLDRCKAFLYFRLLSRFGALQEEREPPMWP